jgi:nitronate monooxygenase
MLHTDLTRALGIEHPILQAGMATDAGAALAAAVSEAGALGCIGSIGGSPADLAAEVEACRNGTQRPFAVNVVTWDWAPFARDLIDVALDGGAPVMVLSFGDPIPALERVRAAGRKVVVQVQDVDGARRAIAARPDVVIAQGNEAGGHTGRRGTLSFAAQVLDLAGDVPVAVAGGVGSGRGLAAALAMGAGGVHVGTRFKATPEFGVRAGGVAATPVIEAMKRAIVASDGSNTLHDEIVDDACSLDWPNGVTGRVLRNAFTRAWQGRRDDLRAEVARIAARDGHGFAFMLGLEQSPDTALNWAGESAGSVAAIEPAAEVVAKMLREARALLARLAQRG